MLLRGLTWLVLFQLLGTALNVLFLPMLPGPIIGMLRASGYGRGAIIRHYLAYGIVCGLLGAVLGALAGALLAGEVTKLYTQELSIPVSLAELHPTTPLLGLAFGLLTGVLAAWAPAASAARTSALASVKATG